MSDNNDMSWLDKYLDFYNAKLEKVTSKDGITISKLTGKKTTVEFTLNLLTLYNVLKTQYKGVKVDFHLKKEQDMLSVNADDLELINELKSKFGGTIDTDIFKYKYTLQIYKYAINHEHKIDASI